MLSTGIKALFNETNTFVSKTSAFIFLSILNVFSSWAIIISSMSKSGFSGNLILTVKPEDRLWLLSVFIRK